MARFNNPDIKAKLTYVVLFLSFLVSLLISSNFVADRAANHLSELQDSHAELKAELTRGNLQQFVGNRIKILEDLAESPTVISSVMGVELESANLRDLLRNYSVLGKQENIYLLDFSGSLIYSNSTAPFETPNWVGDVLNGQLNKAESIETFNSQHFFRLATAVQYNGLTEGVLIFDIVSQSIEELFVNIISDPIHAFSIAAHQSEFALNNRQNLFQMNRQIDIEDTGLELTFFVSSEVLEQERNDYRWQLSTTMGGVLLLAFSFLTVLIRSFILNPLKQLAMSERHAKLSEQRYQLAVEGSNDGIWDWDLVQDELYLSPRISELVALETSPKRVLHTPQTHLQKIVHPDDLAKLANAFTAELKSSEYEFELRIQNKSSDYGYFRIRGKVQRDDSGKAVRVAGSIANITAKKEQDNKLKQALEQAESANLAKSEFLANMSHEIRTPMNGVLGTLQLLNNEHLPTNSYKLVDTGIKSAESLLTIINDILDLSKIESGALKLESVDSDCRRTFESVCKENVQSAKSKNIELELDIQEGVNSHWQVDPVRLKQILTNLVANAIKFTEVGKVIIKLNNTESGIHFLVTDSGIGMSDVQVNKLFGRFQQADSSTTRKYGGTGLGLAIVKQLLELMDGTIEVTSKVNSGSTFKVFIPLIGAKQPVEVETKQAQNQAPLLTSQKVLLAEDNVINRQIFTAMMASTQAKVTEAFDGQQAVDAVGEEKPDIIFMDIQMPNLDGVAACKLIKELYPEIPIIALTANVMQQDIDHYHEVGFDAHLGKPLDMKLLYSTLSEFLPNAVKA